MLEVERKYEVDASFVLPDLDGCAPPGGAVLQRAAVTLRATYYDTADHRLARSGVSVRHRRGEAPAKAWTLKLPSGTIGTRHEISRPGSPAAIPEDLRWLVAAYTRGAALEPATVVRTVRRAYEIADRDGQGLAEVADDTVDVLDGKRVTLTFREIEVELLAGKAKLLDRVEAVLCLAGAAEGGFTPKHVRALGAAATAPPDLVAAGAVGDDPDTHDVVAAALRRDIARIFAYDPFVRLGEPLANGDTPVHQMRVGCRRLRSDLRTFGPLLEPRWAARLRTELGWVAAALGAARDAEVLRDRLRRTAGADPLAPMDPVAVGQIDAELQLRHEAALAALDETMRTGRYLALLDLLIRAAARPRLTKAARGPAHEVLPTLVGKPWRRLWVGVDTRPGAASLEADGPDEEWHEVRIRAKRARYAAEAVAGVLGSGAEALARALGAVQDVLGEHQDAAIAATTWLQIADANPGDHLLAITAGRLFERERVAVRQARASFDPVWRTATRKRATAWLT